MRHRVLATAATAVIAVAIVSLAGCAAGAWEPREVPEAVGTPGAGFVPAASPTPEQTVMPAAGSWTGIAPGEGYRVVLLTSGDEEPVTTLRDAVTQWADEHGVALRTVDATDADGTLATVAAMDQNPDLIVVVGEDLIDPLAVVSANHLDEQFLVLGAEIPEPTENVTAVDWSGAGYRGTDAGTATAYDASSFTAERSRDAVAAGVAAVLTGMTGVILWID